MQNGYSVEELTKKRDLFKTQIKKQLMSKEALNFTFKDHNLPDNKLVELFSKFVKLKDE